MEGHRQFVKGRIALGPGLGADRPRPDRQPARSAAMSTGRIPLTRLYERTSARGNRYLYGCLGYARVLGFPHETEDGDVKERLGASPTKAAAWTTRLSDARTQRAAQSDEGEERG